MKKKMTVLLLGALGLTQLKAQTTQYVDMRTGVTGATNTGAVQAYGAVEDTWSLTLPSGLPGTAKCAQLTGWPSSSSARWISPAVDGSGTATAVGPYYYIYTMTFTASNCHVGDATINLSEIGADNSSTILFVNGDAYAFAHNTSPLTAQIINVGSSIIPGAVNSIMVSGVFNGNSGNSPSGLLLNGGMTINYLYPAATLTGPTTFCANQPLTFTVNDVPGTATHYFWGIAEWDNVNMMDVPSGYTWSSWYNGSPGNPGTFTFPVNPPCNKYYHVKIAMQDDCTPWNETGSNLIIRINCGPPVNAGLDRTICAGQCTTLGAGKTPLGCSFEWTALVNGVQTSVGHTKNITVCPTETTTYTLTVTDLSTECTSTDQVTVTVEPYVTLDPTFHFTNISWISLNNSYQASVYTNTTLPAGAGFSWIIEALDASGNPYPSSTLTNPSQYWGTPNPTLSSPLLLTGYDYPNSIDPLGIFPSPGVFYSCDYHVSPGCRLLPYRVTHGVWLNECNPWVQQSLILSVAPFLRPYDNNGKEMMGQIIVERDTSAPDYSYLSPFYNGTMPGVFSNTPGVAAAEKPSLNIYPNPSAGLFTIEIPGIEGTMQVFDVMGKNIRTITLNGSNSYKLDLGGHARGIYTVNIISGNANYTQKIVLE